MFIYRGLLVLLAPILLIHIIWKALQCGQWQYFAQRIGIDFTSLKHNSIWFHCASVGEVKSIFPLLDELHNRLPAQHFLVTSNTATSRVIVNKYNKNWIEHAYCPVDWRSSINAFLKSVKPAQCYIIETELWPNMIDVCSQQQIPIAILNGRLSEKTMHSQNWMLRTYKQVLRHIQAVYTRTELDNKRYLQLGAKKETTKVVGDLKLAAVSVNNNDIQTLTKRDFVLIVSTHADEEKKILQACETLLGNVLFVIAPRHPERSGAIASQLHNMGLHIAIHSKHDAIADDTQIYILDTIGELDQWFGTAQAVVMGGSFENIGGHNIIEPMSYHRAVVYGPHMQNFADISDIALAADAAIQVESYSALQQQLANWLHNKSAQHEIEQRAAALISQFETTIPTYADIVTTRLVDTATVNKMKPVISSLPQ